ncbi:helix-turn-helix domain-containing protein [Desulforamulus aeronauticus]|uniref:DNA-binding transcriptional regulator, XRE-family HTH domain n=1 Tax=Desulforamulus aeronauticus DSM 10349 TaxID=1121421 RepID=A0A1M6QFG4_9FIRM|nr:helix-turn-helix transcriptional regulator [Desulforamulus aeronauticus]SHK18797.1 DNA-binding transcriptional regulator, XRE-family HTH domain [Desulforamulus aeronauticus DSM 10349]
MNNLKEIRDLFGYSQEEVARALEVSRVAVSKWENNESKISQSNLERLSLLFNISPDYIIGKPLDLQAIERITRTGQNIREQDKKEDDPKHFEIIRELTKIDVKNLIRDYFLTTKLLLVKAEEIENHQLDDLVKVNKKLGNRLQKIQELRKKGNSDEDDALFLNHLINKYDITNSEKK